VVSGVEWGSKPAVSEDAKRGRCRHFTDGRNGQDRSLAVTLEQLSATLPCISFDSLAGFNGVGSRGAGESRSFAEDDRNWDSAERAAGSDRVPAAHRRGRVQRTCRHHG
jgi:hypothetical protein